MIRNVLFNHLFRHPITDRSRKVPVFPDLPAPQSPLDRRILLEQRARAETFQGPDYLADRVARWKGQQNMHMVTRYFHLFDVKSVFFCDLLEKLSATLAKITLREQVFPIFRTPHQVVRRLVNGMAGSSKRHAGIIAANASAD